MSAVQATATLRDDSSARRPIPLPLKLSYTAFCAVLVPVYWHAYTPWNFLYFCDFALLLTLIGMWLESPFLISMQALAILAPQTIWVVDVTATALGHPLLHMTGYMFNPRLSLFARGLSLFHGWLPFVLAYLVWRVGYDRRAYAVQCVFGVALLWFCFFFAPAAPAPAAHPNMAVNINYVWGTDDAHPQQLMAPALWVFTLCSMVVFGFYTPTHLILSRVVQPARRSAE